MIELSAAAVPAVAPSGAILAAAPALASSDGGQIVDFSVLLAGATLASQLPEPTATVEPETQATAPVVPELATLSTTAAGKNGNPGKETGKILPGGKPPATRVSTASVKVPHPATSKVTDDDAGLAEAEQADPAIEDAAVPAETRDPNAPAIAAPSAALPFVTAPPEQPVPIEAATPTTQEALVQMTTVVDRPAVPSRPLDAALPAQPKPTAPAAPHIGPSAIAKAEPAVISIAPTSISSTLIAPISIDSAGTAPRAVSPETPLPAPKMDEGNVAPKDQGAAVPLKATLAAGTAANLIPIQTTQIPIARTAVVAPAVEAPANVSAPVVALPAISLTVVANDTPAQAAGANAAPITIANLTDATPPSAILPSATLTPAALTTSTVAIPTLANTAPASPAQDNTRQPVIAAPTPGAAMPLSGPNDVIIPAVAMATTSASAPNEARPDAAPIGTLAPHSQVAHQPVVGASAAAVPSAPVTGIVTTALPISTGETIASATPTPAKPAADASGDLRAIAPVSVAVEHKRSQPTVAAADAPVAMSRPEPTSIVTGSDMRTAAIFAAPAAPATAQSPTQDIAALVDRITEARAAAAPQTIRAALMHEDFGAVSLNFRTEASQIHVTLGSADPGFAPAVQAAAAANMAGQTSDEAQTRRDAPAPQTGAQPQDTARNDASSQQQAQRERAATGERQQSRHAPGRQPANPGERASSTPVPQRRGGIYA